MKNKKLLALLLVPAFGVLGLAGCGTDRTAKDVTALYTEMTNDNSVTSPLFQDGIIDIDYSVELFNITSTAQASDINPNLANSYVQLNTLYSSALKVGSIYYNNHEADVIGNNDSKVSKSETTILYNKLTTLKNNMSILADAKAKVEEKAELSDGNSTNAVQNLHGYTYTYAGAIESYLDYSKYYSDIVKNYQSTKVDILDNADATNEQQTLFINGVIDRAVLYYTNYVYLENIKAYCTNNSCDTLPLADSYASSLNLISNLTSLLDSSAMNVKHITVTDSNKASVITRAKTLYSALATYEQYFTFYTTAYSSVDYNGYTQARLTDLENGNNTAVKSFTDGLSVKNEANLDLIEDFIAKDSVALYSSLRSLVG